LVVVVVTGRALVGTGGGHKPFCEQHRHRLDRRRAAAAAAAGAESLIESVLLVLSAAVVLLKESWMA
jgi:hypothetical protein